VRDALSLILTAGGSPLTVVDDQDGVAGLVTLELIGGLLGERGTLAEPDERSEPGGDSAAGGDSGAGGDSDAGGGAT
jgi:hypothetical protein